MYWYFSLVEAQLILGLCLQLTASHTAISKLRFDPVTSGLALPVRKVVKTRLVSDVGT